jgi:hypothetical protein
MVTTRRFTWKLIQFHACLGGSMEAKDLTNVLVSVI